MQNRTAPSTRLYALAVGFLSAHRVNHIPRAGALACFDDDDVLIAMEKTRDVRWQRETQPGLIDQAETGGYGKRRGAAFDKHLPRFETIA